ncbi:MAG: TPM domain-containing protein [Planctomycetes bacterium]|nr:TPM domain-containing protein [Planctomycetota bacterium]
MSHKITPSLSVHFSGASTLRRAGLATLFSLACLTPARDSRAQEPPLPSPRGEFVSDFASVVSPEEVASIEDAAVGLASETGVRLVAVTVTSCASAGGAPNGDIEALARRLFTHWGIGRKPQDDGILLLLALEDRKFRIQLGPGCDRRLDAEIPAIEACAAADLRERAYGHALCQAVAAVAEAVRGRPAAHADRATSPAKPIASRRPATGEAQAAKPLGAGPTAPESEGASCAQIAGALALLAVVAFFGGRRYEDTTTSSAWARSSWEGPSRRSSQGAFPPSPNPEGGGLGGGRGSTTSW